MIENIISNISDALYTIAFFNVLSLFGNDHTELPISICILFIGFIYFTVKLNFVQIFCLKKGIRQIFYNESSNNETGVKISPFKSFFTAVASSAGLNNTAGVASMILVAGPGTVFWIPIIVFLCMAFRFAEIYLSHKYRSTTAESVLGGPFDYMKKGLGEIGFNKTGKYLAMSYAVILAMTGLFGISLFEMNQAVQIITDRVSFLHDQDGIVAIVCTSIVAYVLFGGSKRISNVFGAVMPVLVLTFLAISIMVILVNIDKLPSTINLIVHDAFHPASVAGGFLASLLICVRRMSMSNETGLGTAGIVHSLSSEQSSVKEALGGMISPLISGICIALMTAIVVVITGVYHVEGGKDGILLLAEAFDSVNRFFPLSLTIMIPIMAINVMIGWSNYGIKCIEYTFGVKYVRLYVIMYLILGFAGAFVKDFQVVMKIVDVCCMMMVLVNVPVVMILGGKVKSALKGYLVHDKQ